jgi:2-iminobutanoate/2-iminopropanoate deaminase
MEPIYTSKAPRPAGHYSQAIVHNDLVFVSGQLPIDPHTGKACTASIEEQTKQALRNLEEILKASGSSLRGVIRTTVYVADIALWDQVNQVYASYFGEHRPARAVVPTRELHFGCQIEIDAIAVII